MTISTASELQGPPRSTITLLSILAGLAWFVFGLWWLGVLGLLQYFGGVDLGTPTGILMVVLGYSPFIVALPVVVLRRRQVVWLMASAIGMASIAFAVWSFVSSSPPDSGSLIFLGLPATFVTALSLAGLRASWHGARGSAVRLAGSIDA